MIYSEKCTNKPIKEVLYMAKKKSRIMKKYFSKGKRKALFKQKSIKNSLKKTL
jgi:hypothetical protein